LILDTPGMRELGLWDAGEGMAAAFSDVEALAQACRFKDCAHGAEPGCAIRAALSDGTLDEGRWGSFGKLQRELAFEARKEDPIARAALKKVWISRTKGVRAEMNRRGRWDED